MEHKLATAEKKVLVELVKLVQKRGMQGTNGGWKDFLESYDKKFGSSLSDPSKRSNDALVAFLNTFTKKEDLKFFARVLQYNWNRDVVNKTVNGAPEKESPEQRLVRLTVEHPEYPLDYTFPSYSEDWLVTRLGKKSELLKCNNMIAIDCEMVLCEDGTEAVVRVGIVDRNLKVKLDAHVKPDKPVVDYRTDITGVTAEDVEGATRTLADMQKYLRRILSSGAILVGHSLNNDLHALKVDHARVIDTALVFKYSGARKHKRPSLSNLCQSVLGYELRAKDAPHDCVQDAATAMKLVLAIVEHGVDCTVELTKDVLEKEMSKLFLHRIPHNVPGEELRKIISGDYALEIKLPKKAGGCFAAIVTFKNPEEANEAFENVTGMLEKDSAGLPQKLVTFQLESGSGASLYVRKMVNHESASQISAKKRASLEEILGDSKRQKIASNESDDGDISHSIGGKMIAKTEGGANMCSNKCDDHLKEIEKLKQQLKEKDFQLTAQDKIISDLKKKVEVGRKKRAG